MMDMLDHIARTRRQVDDGAAEKAVILTRTYDTSIDDLWDACTDPERLARWFEPVTGDLREGGRFHLDSGSGGTIDRCDPPHRLRVTWEFDGQTSRVELMVSDAGGRATLQLQHAAPEDEQWRTLGPGAGGVGWDIAFLTLGLHLADDPRAEPAEAERLLATPDGATFLLRAAHAWGDAHAAAGADEQVARDAAEQTAAAYSGADPNG